jgi:hypothetical protein
MYTATKVTILALGLAMPSGLTAQAQNSAPINVTADVQQPITVLAGNALTFGNVFPGVVTAVNLASPSAGRFDVTGQASAPVSMTFVVPANLTWSGNDLAVAFTGVWNGINDPSGTSIASFAGATGATFSATGTLFVFIGGTVTPLVSQPAGNYAGTVQMTVVY